MLVTFTPPAAMAGSEGTLSVSLEAGGETVTDGAFVVLPRVDTAPAGVPMGTRLAAAEPGFVMPAEWMYAGLAAAVLAVLAVFAFVRTLRARNRVIVNRPLSDAERAEAERLLAQASRDQR